MMEMKKAFSIFIALALIITLAACQGEQVPMQPHEPGSHGTSKEYTFEGSDSVYLTDLLLNLAYDPDKLCDCMSEFTVKTEFGGPYGVNLSQGYARYDGAQADLTKKQIEMIRNILSNQT